MSRQNQACCSYRRHRQPGDHDKANGLVPGFGVATQIINGGVECGGPTEIARLRTASSTTKSLLTT
ncbi:glycoside hydrolase family 19 protein [Enterobacter mori]